MKDEKKYLEKYYNERCSDLGAFEDMLEGMELIILNSFGFKVWMLNQRVKELKQAIISELRLN